MTSNHPGIPGPGGSLGSCSICGDNFMSTIVRELAGMNQTPNGNDCLPFSIGTDQTLYGHRTCLEQLQELISKHGSAYDDLAPHMPEGPLRKMMEQKP